jgi:hypothetical protein
MTVKPDPRRPPRPATWDSPKGTCRFCGEEIIENGVQNKRKNWHKECVDIWNIMSSPSDARRYLWKREQGVCQGCGKDTWKYDESWEVDHRKPLFEANGDLSYWHPDNLQLLCWTCHGNKTKAEATRRALNKKPKDIDENHN